MMMKQIKKQIDWERTDNKGETEDGKNGKENKEMEQMFNTKGVLNEEGETQRLQYTLLPRVRFATCEMAKPVGYARETINGK